MKIARYVVSLSTLAAVMALAPLAIPRAQAQQAQSEADHVWQKEFDTWRAAAKAGKLADYQKYLAAYPAGKFASVAKRRIEKLQSDTAKAPPAAETAGVIDKTSESNVETRAAEFTDPPKASEPAKEPESSEVKQAPPSDAADTEAEPATAETEKAAPADSVKTETEAQPAEEKQTEAVEPTKPPTAELKQASPTEDKDYETWKKAAAANTEIEYKSYLETYPAGTFAALAKARIVQLQAKVAPDVKKEENGSVVNIQLPPKADQTVKQSVEPDAGSEAETVKQVTDPEAESDAATVSRETVPDENAEKQSNLSLAMQFEAEFSPGSRLSIQKRLNLLGYNTGAADGTFGPRTRAAITKWQADNGFEPTGYLQKAERAELNKQTLISYAHLKEQEKAERKQRMAEQRALRRQRERLARRERQREYIVDGEVAPYDPYYAERRVYRVYPDEY